MNSKYILTTLALSSVNAFISRNNILHNNNSIKTITSLRLNNQIRKTHSDESSPSSNNSDDYYYIERQKRLIIMKKNKLSHMTLDTIPCAYCQGEGYIECVKCNEKGCWRCEHTLLEKCPFCDGSGDGRLCLLNIL